MVKRGTASTDNMHTYPVSIENHVAKVQIVSSASEPILAIAATIDYTFDVEIDSSEPLVPKYKLGGTQDGFPAYEVYVMTKKKTGVMDGIENVVSMFQWKPDPALGVEELLPIKGDVTIDPPKEGTIKLP